MIDSESFALWREHPITNAIMEYFTDLELDVREGILNHLTNSQEPNIKVLAEGAGELMAIRHVLHLTEKDLNDYFEVGEE